ncbi:MAG: transposase [Anaerolineae bacterium]|nr:transposase [Anaerolineae bacterium]
MNKLTYKLRYRRHLPHIQPPGATLFVTFRLAGSIPQPVLQQLLAEAEQIDKTLRTMANAAERAQQAALEQRRMFGKWDGALDTANSGPFWLRQKEIARIVVDEMHRQDNQTYSLDAFCVMPNHVHMVFTPLPANNNGDNQTERYHALSRIMQALKGRSAIQANAQLGREGQFWQHESYDHVIRDEDEWRRIVEYVLHNPVKAGLVNDWEDWPWTYCKST